MSNALTGKEFAQAVSEERGWGEEETNDFLIMLRNGLRALSKGHRRDSLYFDMYNRVAAANDRLPELKFNTSPGGSVLSIDEESLEDAKHLFHILNEYLDPDGSKRAAEARIENMNRAMVALAAVISEAPYESHLELDEGDIEIFFTDGSKVLVEWKLL